jgi:flagellar biosynthesis anti-sigma factor FlgM
MKIDPNVSLPQNSASQRVEQSSSAPARAQSEKATVARKDVQDQAQLSVDQGRVNQLQAEVARLPDVRQDRVEALQRAVQDGSFQVSNEQIADKLFAELLGDTLFNK